MPKKIHHPLSDAETERIKRNWKFLKENLAQHEIRDNFIDKGIWDLRDLEEIDNGKIQEQKNEIFLKLLLWSGPLAYGVFIEALQTTGSNYIIERLEGTFNTHYGIQESMNDQVDHK
ncbi:uncharacterized protein LOC111099422 [Crassostrea virginica]